VSLLSHADAVRRIVDALLASASGRFRQLDMVLLRGLPERVIQASSGIFHAGLIRPLQLDLLQDQAFKTGWRSTVLRRQLEASESASARIWPRSDSSSSLERTTRR